MCNDLAALAQAITNEVGIMLGSQSVHSYGRLDPMSVQHVYETENANPVPILSV
jgi:hypothetical protein